MSDLTVPSSGPWAVCHHLFGEGDSGLALLRDGWSAPEHNQVWCGKAGALRVPVSPAVHKQDLFVEMVLRPMTLGPVLPTQSLRLIANGVCVGKTRLRTETAVSFPVPHAVDAQLDLRLECPDATGAAPGSGALRGFGLSDLLILAGPRSAPFEPRARPPLPAGDAEQACRFLTGLSPTALMERFRSLGSTCEFGLVQAQMGHNAAALLRFAGITQRNLLRGLDEGFSAAGDPARLRVLEEIYDGAEGFEVRDLSYGFVLHTRRYLERATPDSVRAEMGRILPRLAERLVEDLQGQRHIFVWHSNVTRDAFAARPILNTIRSYGGCALLYTTLDPDAPAGKVVQEEADLFRGTLPRMAPLDRAGSLDAGAWLSLCANAYRLWREAGHGSE